MTHAAKWAALAGGLTAAAGALVWAALSRRFAEPSRPRRRKS